MRPCTAERATTVRLAAAVAIACAALLGAGVAHAAKSDAPDAPRTTSKWSLGAGFDLQHPGPGDDLMDAMNALGWNVDTADTVYFGLPVPGLSYPYSSGVGYSSLHAWVDYSFAPQLTARAELAISTMTDAHGHQGPTTFEGDADIEVLPYSYALLALYGGSRWKIGGGPTVDITFVNAKVGHEEDHPRHVTAGATVQGTFTCFHYRQVDVLLRASQHFGAKFDIGPYTDSFTTATYVVNDVPLTYTAIGFGVAWAPPAK